MCPSLVGAEEIPLRTVAGGMAQPLREAGTEGNRGNDIY